MSKSKTEWIGHVPTGPMPHSQTMDATHDRLMRARGLLRKDGKLTKKAERILFDHFAGKCGCKLGKAKE